MSDLAKIDAGSIYPFRPEAVAEKAGEALRSITEMGDTIAVWNRSSSDSTMSLMTLGEHAPCRRLRQIAAELKRRRDALVEAIMAHKENLAQAAVYESQIDDAATKEEAELLRVKADKERAYARMKHEGIMGASKDVDALKREHSATMAAIIDKHGHFDEQVFEAEEREYWIRRTYIQAMQDIRAHGSVSKCEQVAIEQIGLEPLEVEQQIKQHLSIVAGELQKGRTIAPDLRETFLRRMVERHANT